MDRDNVVVLGSRESSVRSDRRVGLLAVGMLCCAVLALCAALLACGRFVWRSDFADILVTPACNERDQALLEQLIADPVFTSAPSGFSRAKEYHLTPCQRDSDHTGLAYVELYPEGPPNSPELDTAEAVVQHYRNALTDAGWHIAKDAWSPPKRALCAERRVRGQLVHFRLVEQTHAVGYFADIHFLSRQRDLGCYRS